MHVDEDGSLRTQEEVMARLQGDDVQKGQLSLFPEATPARAHRSRGKYAPGSD
jgi:hypothetical protein